MPNSELTQLSIKDLHAGYAAGKFSPVEVTDAYLKAASGDKLNAYLHVATERARGQAKAAEKLVQDKKQAAFESHPLLGIPLGIKDIFTIEGMVTTCGSKILETYVPPYTATSVKKLEDAGAVSLGKLNMDEFAMGGSNENSAYGPVKHPTHEGYVPGGSSGGSSTAVRALQCVAALGTDTGGSIRLPAAYCGIVGMKPTYGTVSRFGMVAFSSSLDQGGPMARSVEDAARVLDVMSGYDNFDSTSLNQPKLPILQTAMTKPDLKKLRIGIPKEYMVGGLQKEVQAKVEASINWFKSQGAEIVEISLPNTQSSVAVYYIVAVSEASSNLARFDGVKFGVRPKALEGVTDLTEFYKKTRALFGPEVKRRIILGTFALSSGYYDAYFIKACQVRRLIQDDFKRAFEKVEVIAAPVSPTTAYKLGAKTADPLEMYLNDIFTIPVNLAGLPALSVPCGEDAAGLPIGLHLIGNHFSDGKLLSIARAFEEGRGA